MSGADEKMRAVLERVATECFSAAMHDRSADEQDVQSVLESHLLPLLLAGQAMRDWRVLANSGYGEDWDAALAAAQGQPEKESGRCGA